MGEGPRGFYAKCYRNVYFEVWLQNNRHHRPVLMEIDVVHLGLMVVVGLQVPFNFLNKNVSIRAMILGGSLQPLGQLSSLIHVHHNARERLSSKRRIHLPSCRSIVGIPTAQILKYIIIHLSVQISEQSMDDPSNDNFVRTKMNHPFVRKIQPYRNQGMPIGSRGPATKPKFVPLAQCERLLQRGRSKPNKLMETRWRTILLTFNNIQEGEKELRVCFFFKL